MADLGATRANCRTAGAVPPRREHLPLDVSDARRLGLLLGTFGLATVLLRNVLERKRELALLGAVGYRRAHVMMMVVAENVLLLVAGLAMVRSAAGDPSPGGRGARQPAAVHGGARSDDRCARHRAAVLGRSR